MKKVLLLCAAIAVSLNGFSQVAKVSNQAAKLGNVKESRPSKSLTHSFSAPETAAARTTDVSDTTFILNNSSAYLFDSSLAYYYASEDSGFAFGINQAGVTGAAELYFSSHGGDSTTQVLGLVTYWSGNVNPTSTKNVTFKLFSNDTNLYYYPFDTTKLITDLVGAAFDSVVVPMTSIKTDTALTTVFFPTPATGINGSFYAGYTIDPYSYSSLGGDTIGLRSTQNGNSSLYAYYYIDATTSDTVLIGGNAVGVGGGWSDIFWEAYNNLAVNLSIVPIIQFNTSTAVASVTKNNFTFSGNYPNPAVNSTTIQYSLSTTDNITVTVTDITGRTINTISQNAVAAGSHQLVINTENMASGDYLYIIRTSKGDGFASKFAVAK